VTVRIPADGVLRPVRDGTSDPSESRPPVLAWTSDADHRRRAAGRRGRHTEGVAMTLPVDRPPAAAEETPPAAETPPARTPDDKRGIEDRGWLLLAVVVAFIVLAYTGMIVLTELGGGSGYVPWEQY
jgi:hypothetical protein